MIDAQEVRETIPKYSVVLLALGANLPGPSGESPIHTLAHAIADLKDCLGERLVCSNLYSTPCFPAGSGPDYVNAAARVESALPPDDILHLLHNIESRFGRERLRRWGQRTLDIDLIAYGDEVHPDAETFRHWLDLPASEQIAATPNRLILPHPRLQDRGFVLVPLAEVAPEWQHPVLGRTVRDLRDALPEAALEGITLLGPVRNPDT